VAQHNVEGLKFCWYFFLPELGF